MYEAPRLVVHGSVARLTLQDTVPGHNGEGDGTLCMDRGANGMKQNLDTYDLNKVGKNQNGLGTCSI